MQGWISFGEANRLSRLALLAFEARQSAYRSAGSDTARLTLSASWSEVLQRAHSNPPPDGLVTCAWEDVNLACSSFAGRIGDLVYDDGRWQVEQHGERYDVRLRKGFGDAGLTVRFAPGAPPACTAETMVRETEGLADRSFKTLAKPGADIHVVAAWLGCRNARPPPVH